ncbi:MAG: OmpA family protein [Prolixibacteraceae bacterium]|nr:OmpA family protein [Prolixibacteraceae bacterium]
MKILIIGLLAFSMWSALATHLYVCKILGLCNEPETNQTFEASLLEAMAEDTLEVTIANDTLEIGLLQEQPVAPEDHIVHFEFDKSEFHPDSFTDKYLDESMNYLKQDTQALLSITGHTDAIGSKVYNQALGYRRAQSMQHYFESNGVRPDRITLQSQGEEEPVDDNNTVAGRANNRRTEITIKN